MQSIQDMEHLEVLSLYCRGLFSPYLNLTNVLKELTIHTLISSDIDMKVSETWVRNDFIPSSLNLYLIVVWMCLTSIHIWNLHGLDGTCSYQLVTTHLFQYISFNMVKQLASYLSVCAC